MAMMNVMSKKRARVSCSGNVDISDRGGREAWRWQSSERFDPNKAKITAGFDHGVPAANRSSPVSSCLDAERIMSSSDRSSSSESRSSSSTVTSIDVIALLEDTEQRAQFYKKRYARLFRKAKETLRWKADRNRNSSMRSSANRGQVGSRVVDNSRTTIRQSSVVVADRKRSLAQQKNEESRKAAACVMSFKNNKPSSCNDDMSVAAAPASADDMKRKMAERQREREAARKKLAEMSNTTRICDPLELTRDFKRLCGQEGGCSRIWILVGEPKQAPEKNHHKTFREVTGLVMKEEYDYNRDEADDDLYLYGDSEEGEICN